MNTPILTNSENNTSTPVQGHVSKRIGLMRSVQLNATKPQINMINAMRESLDNVFGKHQ